MSQQKINELEQRLGELLIKQAKFSSEIRQLQLDIERFKQDNYTSAKSISNSIEENVHKSEFITQRTPESFQEKASKPNRSFPKINIPNHLSDLEKLVGENWISKIGILVLIIGIAIGAKYSIENDLINPLTRIILGYLSGIILLIIGIKLKTKYEHYSAVLVSGSMAIFYFITYFAYGFYELIPQILAFFLMLIFTIFTVISAIHYDKVVIAHIGLVGAYAIPFLLSNNSGKAHILFSYMLILNIGILAISIKKHWKSLYYSSFSFTWLIYLLWLESIFNNYDKYYIIGLIFGTLFFLIFHCISIANKIIQKETLKKSNIILLLLNSFFYFGAGYAILYYRQDLSDYLGLFTIFNAIIFFLTAFFLKSKKLADNPIFYLSLGLFFTFITITIPIQLNGSWITLLWALQGSVLFYIGRVKQQPIYEKISYPIIILTSCSLWMDWVTTSPSQAFGNIVFITSIITITSYISITYFFHNKKYKKLNHPNKLTKIFSIISPILLGINAYYTFHNEIQLFFDNWYYNASEQLNALTSDSIEIFNSLSVISTLKLVALGIYSIIFFGTFSLINYYKIKSPILYKISSVFSIFVFIISINSNLYSLGELRGFYINQEKNLLFDIGIEYVLIRYVVWGAITFLTFSLYKNFLYLSKTLVLPEAFKYFIPLIFLSDELITWLDIAGSKNVFKLGLSILWGIYSLLLISFGIFKQKIHLRIMAIGLFGIALVKLFLYDISHLDTIDKTIVFIILGILLLIISFLYNKFKGKISENDKN